MKKINKAIIKSLLLVSPVYAADQTIEFTSPFGGDLGSITVAQIISALIQFALVAAAVIAFFFLIYGGIRWIMSGGDKEATASAQGTITAAVIGLGVVFAAWAIMNLVRYFFGIDLLGGMQIPKVGGSGAPT